MYLLWVKEINSRLTPQNKNIFVFSSLIRLTDIIYLFNFSFLSTVDARLCRYVKDIFWKKKKAI